MSSLQLRNKTIWISYYRNRIHFRKSLKFPNTNEGWKKANEYKKKLDAEILLEHLDILTNPKRTLLLSEAFQQFNKNGIYKIVYDYLFKVTGDIPVNMILSDHINKIKLEGKSQNTKVTYYNHLGVFFNYLHKNGYVNINPVPKLKSEQKEIVTIPTNELDLIIERLKQKNLQVANLIKFLSLTGFRLGEGLNFKREDINWNEGVIKVKNTKAKRTESFPIYNELKEFLMEDNELYNQDRGYALKLFQDACEKLHLKKYKIHDIRRTFASKSATKLNPMELQKVIRHQDIKTTLKSYVNLNLKEIGNKL